LKQETGLPWVAPSPNLPTPRSALVYPGQVIWEGTNVSEGRGTTQPFELFGAPFLDTGEILAVLGNGSLPGIVLRPVAFEPTANKYSGRLCKGFQIHVCDESAYAPYPTSLRLLQAVLTCHVDAFQWKSPPYEYEFEKLPIDLIIGDSDIRQQLERLDPLDGIMASWKDKTDEFQQMSREYYLYE
jgi:uncharacterized protein YbbC (DUF1343 family)